MKLTHNIIMAIGRDAANRRMKKAGRLRWNIADWNHASKTTAPLFKHMDLEAAQDYTKFLINSGAPYMKRSE